jgi:hypothetical protein
MTMPEESALLGSMENMSSFKKAGPASNRVPVSGTPGNIGAQFSSLQAPQARGIKSSPSQSVPSLRGGTRLRSSAEAASSRQRPESPSAPDNTPNVQYSMRFGQASQQMNHPMMQGPTMFTNMMTASSSRTSPKHNVPTAAMASPQMAMRRKGGRTQQSSSPAAQPAINVATNSGPNLPKYAPKATGGRTQQGTQGGKSVGSPAAKKTAAKAAPQFSVKQHLVNEMIKGSKRTGHGRKFTDVLSQATSTPLPDRGRISA